MFPCPAKPERFRISKSGSYRGFERHVNTCNELVLECEYLAAMPPASSNTVANKPEEYTANARPSLRLLLYREMRDMTC
jgi:hypothetical protein